MRRFFILLGLLALVFVGLLFVPGSQEQPPPNKEEYEASGFFAWLGKGQASRPGYRLQGTPFDVAASGRRDVPFPAARLPNETRLAKLALVSGPAARVRYGSKMLCLVANGVPIPLGCRPKSRATGSILLEASAGQISIEAIGTAVRVESR